MTITEKERLVLAAFLTDNYLAGNLDGHTYSWSILEELDLGQGGPGVFASLSKKGLIAVWDDPDYGDICKLTDAGREIVETLRGEEVES